MSSPEDVRRFLEGLRPIPRGEPTGPVHNEEKILGEERGGYPTERRSADNADRLMSDMQNLLKDREGQGG